MSVTPHVDRESTEVRITQKCELKGKSPRKRSLRMKGTYKVEETSLIPFDSLRGICQSEESKYIQTQSKDGTT